MRRRALILVACGLVLAGCPAARRSRPRRRPSWARCRRPPQVKGDPAAGKQVFATAGCKSCHTLKDAGATGTVGPNLDQAKPPLALVVDRVTNGKGVDAVVQRPAHAEADRGRRRLRRPGHARLILPAGFPRDVEAFACDLDRTLIGKDAELRPRTRARDRGRARGRDPRDRRHRADVPVGAAVRRGRRDRGPGRLLPGRGRRRAGQRADGSGTSRSRSSSRARRSPRSQAEGYPLNCYVGDELYVAEHTAASEAYASFQHLEVHAVGDLLAWLSEPPTKLVAVGDPVELDGLEARLRAHFGGRMYISKSLPYFLEFASPEVTKGSGLAFVAEHLGFTRGARRSRSATARTTSSCSSGRATAVAVENAHERVLAVADFVCPPVRRGGRGAGDRGAT